MTKNVKITSFILGCCVGFVFGVFKNLKKEALFRQYLNSKKQTPMRYHLLFIFQKDCLAKVYVPT
jgi:hypothetical protein